MPKSSSYMSPSNKAPSILYANPLPSQLPKRGMAYYLLPAQIVDPGEPPKHQLEHFLKLE